MIPIDKETAAPQASPSVAASDSPKGADAPVEAAAPIQDDLERALNSKLDQIRQEEQAKAEARATVEAEQKAAAAQTRESRPDKPEVSGPSVDAAAPTLTSKRTFLITHGRTTN